MSNSLKKLEEEREKMLPPELEDRITSHLGSINHWGDMAELFVSGAVNTMAMMFGSNRARTAGSQDDTGVNWREKPEPTHNISSDDI
jgi:hypothetical protein